MHHDAYVHQLCGYREDQQLLAHCCWQQLCSLWNLSAKVVAPMRLCCAGLHPAVPYFSQLITEEVKANLRDLPRLHLLLKVSCMLDFDRGVCYACTHLILGACFRYTTHAAVDRPETTGSIVAPLYVGWPRIMIFFVVLQALQSLLANPHVQMEPYLHQLMPAVLTCLVGKKLGVSPVPEGNVRTSGTASRVVTLGTYAVAQAVQLAAAVCHTSLVFVVTHQAAVTRR